MQHQIFHKFARLYSSISRSSNGICTNATSAAHLSKEEALNDAKKQIVDFEGAPKQFKIHKMRKNETLPIRKQRLIYQSRKRGMLENDLILSTFVAKYLKQLNAELTAQYDELINGVSNDWDIFYWVTEAKPTPTAYDNEIMHMLKDHVKNVSGEKRILQPALEKM